jgi:ribonuclease BN (tRNA processing enzyme)
MAFRLGTLIAGIAAGVVAALAGGLLVLRDVAPRAVSGAPSPQAAGGRPHVGVIMLGTGTPVPDAAAWGPASAVVVGDRLFLVDAGAGVTRRLAAAGFPRVKDVAATFLTHLHSDHTLGYPDLIFTTWIMGRREPLAVYGPPGLRRMTDGILDAWRDDVDLRVKGLERETREWLRVNAIEIQAGVVYDRDGVKVTAIPVPHGDWPAFAYRFDAPGRSITFAGDTAPGAALLKAAPGTDILVHEVYNGKRVAPEARPGGESWPEYLRTYHTSDAELARVASEVKPGLLVLHHVLRLGGTDEEILQNIREAGYKGRVVVAKDLDRF